MEHWDILTNILALMAAATLLGTILERLGQNAILGYLLAGVLLGPGVLGLFKHGDEVNVLAELGVALLLFTIGLEFSWQQLRQLGRFALIGGILQIVLTLGAAVGVSRLTGTTVPVALVIGSVVALSSTACVLGVFAARAEMDSVRARNALGILLVQDMAVIPLVLVVDILGQKQNTVGEFLSTLLVHLFILGLLVAVFYGMFRFLAPWLFRHVGLRQNRELPILLAVIAALAAALGAHALQVSPALGAFIAGMLLAVSPFAAQIRSDVVSLKTLLMTLFFGSIGMLADPAWMWDNAGLVIGVVIAIILGKTLIVAIIALAFRLPINQAVATGLCLAQVGEFSFVLAQGAYVGAETPLIDIELFRLLISAALISLLATPALIRNALQIGDWVEYRLLRQPSASGTSTIATNGQATAARVILIGFGPAGKKAAVALAPEGHNVLVIDQNPGITNAVRDYGFSALVGDARQGEIWSHIALAQVRLVVVTVPDPRTAGHIVKLIRDRASCVPIIARCRYNRYHGDLLRAGAQIVLDEEEIIGQTLAGQIEKILSEEK